MRWITLNVRGRHGRGDSKALIGFGAGGIVGAVDVGHRTSRLVGDGPFADTEVYAGPEQIEAALATQGEAGS